MHYIQFWSSCKWLVLGALGWPHGAILPFIAGPWDLLAWASSPLWASLIVVLLLILGVPMSWHKAALSDTIDWIGWRISVSYWTIEVPFGNWSESQFKFVPSKVPHA
jgi:hypothetical protein